MAFQAPQFSGPRAAHLRHHQATLPRPVWYDQAANAHGNQAQALSLPTKEMKMRIDILAAWLGCPGIPRDDRIEMQVRLDAYRAELRRRGTLAKAKAQRQRQQMH